MLLESSTILADSDLFVGYLIKTDAHHKTAEQFLQTLDVEHGTLYTTAFVVVETTNLLARRFSHALATQFLAFLEESGLDVLEVTTEDRLAAQSLFCEHKSNHTSLVDCMNVIIAKRHGLTQIGGFDGFYTQFGLHVLHEMSPAP